MWKSSVWLLPQLHSPLEIPLPRFQPVLVCVLTVETPTFARPKSTPTAMRFPPLPIEDLEHVLVHTGDHWAALRGNRIFVTGATGFFGIWLLETFAHANDRLNLGAELVALSRDPESFTAKVPHIANHPSIRLLKGDVRNFDFPGGNFSHVIHAGTTSSKPVPPLEMWDTIHQGTRRTLDFAVATGARDVLLVSSGAVYGKQPPGMTHIPETFLGAPSTSDPNAAYGEGKRAAELIGSIFRQEFGLRVKCARCFAFVGPHLPLDAHFAVGNFIRDALRGGPIQIQGDGTPMRSYLYAADLALWLWTILLANTQASAYNVGSSVALSIAETAKTVASTIDNPVRIEIQQKAASNSQPSYYVPCVELSKSELGLEESISIQNGIQKTISWIQSQLLYTPKPISPTRCANI